MKIVFDGRELEGVESWNAWRNSPPFKMQGQTRVTINDNTGKAVVRFDKGAAGHRFLGGLPEGHIGILAVEEDDHGFSSQACLNGWGGGPDIVQWEFLVIAMPRDY